MTLTKYILLSATVPLVFAGCASTNPRPAFNDVNRIVTARLGETVEWPGHASNPQITEAVDSLLKTNLTAQSATAIALLNNRSLRAEFEQIGISQAALAQASRLQNPVIFGDWRFPDRPPSAVDAEYSAAGNVLDLLTLPARKKIAAHNLEQTKLAVAGEVLRLAAATQRAFYQLQAQMQLTNRLAVIVAVNNAAADFAQRQYQAGNITDLALHEQLASAAQSHLEWMQAHARTLADREQLNRLLGLSEQQINWTILDQLPLLPKVESSLTNLESLALNQRLDLAASRAQAESIAAVLRLKEHTRYIPGIMVGVDAERTPDGQHVTGPTLDLELPLFDQGQPAVARLTAEYRQARDNYEALKANVSSQVRQAREEVLAAREEVEFSKTTLLPLRRQVLGETLLHYNAMQASTDALLLARKRELIAEEGSVAALRDYWVARVALDHAVGGRLDEAVYSSGHKSAPSDSTKRQSGACVSHHSLN